MERKDELTILGKTTAYRQDYAPEVLEAFTNKHPENDYWVRFNCPEFTSLCPITGQPDFHQLPARCENGGKQKLKAVSLQLPQSRGFPRRLRKHHHERPYPPNGPEIHRSDGYLYSARGHFHLSVLQLRTSGNQV